MNLRLWAVAAGWLMACATICPAIGDDKMRALTVGDDPPPIELQALVQGPSASAANWDALRGKVVVLEFWATWCGPCVGAISHLNELTDAFQDRPVQFLSITDEDEPTIKAFLSKKAIHGWVGLNPKDSMFSAFGKDGIPLTVIVGTNGKIAAITHPNFLEAKHIENVLAGRESGLPAIDDNAPTVPANRPTEPPALFQFIIRRASGDDYSWTAGGGEKNELGSTYEINAHGISFMSLMFSIHGVTGPRLVMDAPVIEGRFDMIARIPVAARKELDAIKAQAIEVTFGLTSRREIRELDVYVATVKETDRKGLQPTAAPKARSSSSRPGRSEAINIPVATWLSSHVEGVLRRPVIDETGLSGGYDIELRWDTDANQPILEPAKMIDIVREQTGLELTPARRPVEVVVVSRKQP